MMMCVMFSCTPDWTGEMEPGQGNAAVQPDREPGKNTRKVLLLYMAGYNNLKGYLETNIADLKTGWIPKQSKSNDILLVYSHFTRSRGDYNTPTEPVLARYWTDGQNNIIIDTIAVYPSSSISASAEQINEVLSFVKEEFPAQSYGMVFSSHATGYLPSGFYSNPGGYIFNEGMMQSQGRQSPYRTVAVPYIEPERDPSLPMVKSIGQSVIGSDSYEIDLRDFAKAVPMKLDYLLFDACLMGGIEVAYELAGICNHIGFSQAEVLAAGFNYKTITSHLLANTDISYPERVCEDYFNQYNVQTDNVQRSATISLVDCNKLEPMAELCNELFARYRIGLGSITPSKVQRYYTGSHHWFYDLESILSQAGASVDDLNRLKETMDGCIIYKAATPSFLGSFKIETFSGLSMYLPCNGNQELDKYYKTLKWNQSTGLVK